MTELLQGVLLASMWVSIAVVLLAALRPLLRRLGGAPLVYRSWWLLPLVLLAPLLPLPGVPLVEATPVHALGAALRAPELPADAVLWPAMLVALWAAGALLAGIRQWRGQRRFERGMGALHPRSDGSWQASADPGLPALVGLWSPRVVVGPDFDLRFSAAERALILQHECQHRRHGDHWANAALALLRCLFWFHPLLPWASRRFLRDQELACDARTVDPYPASRRLYANALLKAQLVHPVAPMACHWRSQPMLKERIAMMKEHKRSALPWVTGQVLVVGLCMGLGAVAWASQAGSGGSPAISAEPFQFAQEDAAKAGLERPVTIDRMPPPSYPASAFENNQSGEVVLRVEVDAQGRVSDVRVLSATNPGVFDAASIAAARQWTYRPAMKDGKAVAAAVRIPVNFAMTETVTGQ
ncbi:TonB family protein [Stenotrophomonas sp. SORGH_AS_0282]|uniref:M56 family metallopeptidase n=1 Tax=Stenotrophomonas sp. SORGH_AS_0282 TaxID=3041763 RepID=UPI002780B9E0|nr:TonB family protein [Stenotrophomonas sp. SORGH_AS_0282]MDQ1061634.1 TonB family protein [Stenotrophomonas sp. SORGH_AS_0282]MDQ1190014.1 TonB family protein [Stenotrophomonas sp. SORGH_AS_0282]